jgi:hypothetical protein
VMQECNRSRRCPAVNRADSVGIELALAMTSHDPRRLPRRRDCGRMPGDRRQAASPGRGISPRHHPGTQSLSLAAASRIRAARVWLPWKAIRRRNARSLKQRDPTSAPLPRADQWQSRLPSRGAAAAGRMPVLTDCVAPQLQTQTAAFSGRRACSRTRGLSNGSAVLSGNTPC